MKKLILILAILLIPLFAFAATSVTLNWDPNTEPDLAGYRLYRSTTSGSGYSKVGEITAPSTEFTDTVIMDGTYYWVVTAFDANGNESGFSNEVSAVLDSTPPGAPAGLKITITIVIGQ